MVCSKIICFKKIQKEFLWSPTDFNCRKNSVVRVRILFELLLFSVRFLFFCRNFGIRWSESCRSFPFSTSPGFWSMLDFSNTGAGEPIFELNRRNLCTQKGRTRHHVQHHVQPTCERTVHPTFEKRY